MVCNLHSQNVACEDEPRMTKGILYLDDVRVARMKRVQSVQHAVVAATMAVAGYSHLHEAGGVPPIAVLELAAATALFAAIALDFRRESRGSHARFGWIEIASGVILFVEGASKGTHKLIRPQYVSGLVLLTLGVFEARLSHRRKRRRSLEAKGDALKARLGFRGFEILWSEIAKASHDGQRLEIRRTDGRTHTIKLRTLRNADEVIAWLGERMKERGLLLSGRSPADV